jgi:16S rRNA (uracil1498-N3)-methyltransferase
MPTNHRLFVDAPLGELFYQDKREAPTATLTLPSEASHYLTRVLRLRAGAEVMLFNGDGNNYAAKLTHADKRSAELELLSASAGPNASPKLHLAVALLKGDKLDFVLQKATELDVSSIWLTRTARCELRLSEKRLENRLKHWQRIIQSACEQSGRTQLPSLHAPRTLDDVLTLTQGFERYSLEPSATAGELNVTSSDVCLITGPEGGFDPAEAERLARDSVSVQLGELVLRAETAPLVGLSLLSAARRRSQTQL